MIHQNIIHIPFELGNLELTDWIAETRTSVWGLELAQVRGWSVCMLAFDVVIEFWEVGFLSW